MELDLDQVDCAARGRIAAHRAEQGEEGRDPMHTCAPVVAPLQGKINAWDTPSVKESPRCLQGVESVGAVVSPADRLRVEGACRA